MGTNTGIGIGIGIPFKNNALGGDRPYLPPELKARLIGVWDNYGKKNTDADRNIIKNKIPNAGGDLEILNAAYKLNSGFGEYKEDFTSWRIYPNIEVTDNVITTNGNFNSTWFIYKHANENEINEMNIKVSGIPEGGIIRYFYIPDETATIPVSYNISEDGVYHLPKSKLSSNRISIGFTVSSSYDWNNIRIEQLSDFGGAFVTDGVNDMIISQKTLQEMGVTKDFTVVSMIHQISWRGSGSVPLTNYIRPTDNIYVRNQVADIGKTGIYGYVIYDVNNTSVNNSRIINTVLGDKNDYSIYTVGNLSQGKFSVQGYIDGNDNIREISSVAHYWTFALLGKATEDDINLIIAYFNLDRTLKPDIRCNIERQGITNDNHADFNDRLIDYSGNGRDIQMYNLAWKGGSGIAAKPFETIKDYTIVSDEARQKLTIYNEFSYKIKSNTPSYYWTVQSIIRDNTSYQVTIITDKDCYWINATSFINSEGNKESIRKRYPVLANTPTQVIICGLDQFEYPEGIEPTSAISYVNLEYAGEITITFIPSHKGGLLLDGVNDFGKVTGMPIYKDYTIVVDYERFYLEPITGGRASILSKSSKVGDGSFIFNLEDQNGGKACYTFGEANISDDITRIIRYQSKYYNTKTLSIGTAEDNDFMVLGKVREADSRYFYGAIYSLMSFPYSMSEFLIERQLKKHKLGTLYPDMVEFRPIVKSNSEYQVVDCYIDTFPAVVGNYYPINSKLRIAVITKGKADEVISLTVNGVSLGTPSVNGNRFTFNSTLSDKSPQKINITIDEYIRYEDIVQPYPVIFQITDRNTNQRYSWGDKIKVGSSIRLSQGEKPNLLFGLYSIQSYEYEGKTYSYNQLTNLNIILTKQSISLSCNKIWLLDDNEPKCILSPRLLRIPNSSYKILGHIPDISGHGNHGKINNSAYAGASGANGYPYDYNNSSFWCDSVLAKVVSGELIEYFAVKNSTGFSNITSGVYKGEIKVTGVTKAISENKISRLRIYTNSTTDNELIDITQDGNYNIDIKGVGDANRVFFYAIPNNPNESIVVRLTEPIYIEQVGEYEGAYCFDGVDDFVDIPTLSSGGKQVLMKVNSLNSDVNVIYDQRLPTNMKGTFAIMCDNNLAYSSWNTGQTYIDGMLNKNITGNQLVNITHNLTITHDGVTNNNSKSPFIGKSTDTEKYAKMALYDFMLFDNISTDDKIKELNEYVGIEAKVELPPYYWDAYGKTNLDGDKATIQQRGVAVGDYDLTNSNFAYEGMSGYNGYPVVFGANKTWEQMPTGTFTWNIDDNKLHITKALIAGNGLLFSYVKLNGSLLNVKEIPSFKIKVSGLEGKSKLWYRYLKTEDAISETTAVLENGTHELPKSYTPSDSLHDGVWIGFTVSPISEGVKEFDCDITIEVLPEYENGLVYDGITDYSKNANIPALDDFTAIIKREWLKKQGCPLIKGSKVYEGGNGNALLLEWDKAYNFVFYKRTDIMEGELPDNISFITPTNYNGNVITRGSEQDTNGICIAGDGNAGFANMVFYKLILYPKTIPLLQINFLKNLMERDEIIDLNNPIFIKNE